MRRHVFPLGKVVCSSWFPQNRRTYANATNVPRIPTPSGQGSRMIENNNVDRQVVENREDRTPGSGIERCLGVSFVLVSLVVLSQVSHTLHHVVTPTGLEALPLRQAKQGLENTTGIDQDKERFQFTMNDEKKTKKSWWKIALGALAGAAVGLGFYYAIGCPTGGCPITSNPVVSSIYGAVLGGWMTAS